MCGSDANTASDGNTVKYFTIPMRLATWQTGTAKIIGAKRYEPGVKVEKLSMMILEPDGSIWYWPVDEGAFPTFDRLGKIE